MSDFTVTLGDLVLPCADLSDDMKFAIVRHRVPGRNGAILENLGADEMEFRLRTVFIGKEAVADYVDLLTVLRQGASVTASHPIYGTFQAMVGAVAAKYDQRIDTAEVDFTIIEDGMDWGVVYRPNASDLALTATQAALDGGVCPDLDPGGVCRDIGPVDLSDPSWLDKVYALNLGNKINSYVSAISAQLNKIDALQLAISSPLTAAFNALNFASTLPGQVARKITALCDVMSGSAINAPDPVLAVQRLSTDLDSLVGNFKGTPVDGAMRVMASLTGARIAAAVMATDEDNLNAQVALEQSVTFDVYSNYVGKSFSPPPMPATADQVGRMVVAMRGLLNAARPYTSAPQPLEDMALALQQQYRDRLVRYETLREITVAQPTPLHVLCLLHGLPYNAAERLVRLNNIRSPSFTEGTIRIYVR